MLRKSSLFALCILPLVAMQVVNIQNAPARAQDDPTATPAATQAASDCNSQSAQAVANHIAEAFNISAQDFLAWHCKGYGFGEIVRAYLLVEATAHGKTPLTVDQIFAMRTAGMGWGEILHLVGVNPRDVAPGQIFGRGHHKGHGHHNGHKHNQGAQDDSDDGSTDD